MPRAIHAATPIDEVAAEILFTRAALAADPAAEALLAQTDGWTAMIEGVRTRSSAVLEAVAKASAARQVANQRLDDACRDFARDLLHAVGGDRSAPRWRRYFRMQVSTFVERALAAQIADVKAWLAIEAKDDAFETHRVTISEWNARAEAALIATRATGTLRGDLEVARVELAEDLTRERDALAGSLATIAREQGLPRGWEKAFFRSPAPRSATSHAPDGEETAAATPTEAPKS